MLLRCCEENGTAFLSGTATGDETWVFHYTPESKAESLIWKHSHSPVKMKFKTVQSPGTVVATVFWGVYSVLLVGVMPLGSKVKAAAYQKTLQRLKPKGPGC